MNFRIQPSNLTGTVAIPGSKSHTIRALILALMAEGTSRLRRPLYSSDTASCVNLVKSLGGDVEEKEDLWLVHGVGKNLLPPEDVIDVGNSGTTLYLGMGISSLIDGITVLTGDHQIRSRPAGTLLRALNDLGCDALSTRGKGTPPVVITGPLSGGQTSIEAVTSQYLSSLLIAAPFGRGQVEIEVPLLNEKPYVTMTLRWLESLGLSVENEDYKRFSITGGQAIKPFDREIPGDFSSATFFMVAGALSQGTLTLNGLDFTDSQGDKEVVNILKDMGAEVVVDDFSISITGGTLKGGEYDLNDIPDALPALAVAGCFATGTTKLVNVAQARVKETDRIAVMKKELEQMGASIEERDDGLVIHHSPLKGAVVNGHGDHRVVMSLAIGASAAEGETVIDGAEAAAVTFPEFSRMYRDAGGSLKEEE